LEGGDVYYLLLVYYTKFLHATASVFMFSTCPYLFSSVIQLTY
jgi:hypothetical protein